MPQNTSRCIHTSTVSKSLDWSDTQKIKRISLILIAPLLILLSMPTVYADIQLTFGVYTSDKPSSMVRKFRPILNALEPKISEQLGETVYIRLQVVSSYTQGIENLVTGKVDFSRIGPASYILSKQQNPDIQLLAMESNKGMNTFYGVICVHKNSTIKNINQIKGQRFAFGDKNSTIGRFLSQQVLSENGVFAVDLVKYEYLGRHDRVGTAVGANQFDAGALKESAFIKSTKAGIPIKELARFPLVTQPWVASSLIDAKIYSAIKKALLTFNNIEALEALKTSGFLPVKDSDYHLIRKAIRNNDLFFNNPLLN